MNVPLQPPDAPAGPILEGAAWNWLLDLRARLNVLVEIIDRSGAQLLPPIASESAARLRTLLGAVDRARLDAATRRIGSEESVAPLRVDGLMLVVFLLDPDRDLRLVVAEPADATNAPAGHELAGVGEWLARSIASERAAQPSATGSGTTNDWHEVAVLHRLLNQAGSGGSAREVVRMFVEAMAIWTDADVRVYVGDVSGRFTLDVALASADRSAAPLELRESAVTGSDLERLTPGRASDLGFRSGDAVALARVHTARTAPWLLAHLGPLDRRGEIRLAAFVDVLGPRLDAAAEVEASRLLWALMQRLMLQDASAPDSGIAEALRELGDFVPCHAALRIVGAGDRVVLEAGDVASLQDAGPVDGQDRFDVRLRTESAYSAVLALRAPIGHALTVREQRLAEVAASVLQTWLDGLAAKGVLVSDRRREATNTFEDLLSLHLNPPRRAERPVSLLVVAMPVSDVPIATKHAAIAELRRHLRPFDAVGLLASGEIGIWLPGAALEHGSLVRDRLQDLLRTPSVVPSLACVPVGVAASTVAEANTEMLVATARTDAQRRSGGV